MPENVGSGPPNEDAQNKGVRIGRSFGQGAVNEPTGQKPHMSSDYRNPTFHQDTEKTKPTGDPSVTNASSPNPVPPHSSSMGNSKPTFDSKTSSSGNWGTTGSIKD